VFNYGILAQEYMVSARPLFSYLVLKVVTARFSETSVNQATTALCYQATMEVGLYTRTDRCKSLNI
jgi:hypothetical protein